MAAMNLGDDDAAMTLLENAIAGKATFTPWINSYPGYDRLRSMSRFQALIESLQLPAIQAPIRPEFRLCHMPGHTY